MPFGLSIVGSVTSILLDDVHDIIVEGSLCYLIGDDRLTIVDVSNPLHPFVFGNYRSVANLHSPQSLAKSGNYVFVACTDDDYVTSIDVSIPNAPTFGSKLIDAVNFKNAAGIGIVGSHAFVGADTFGLGADILNAVNISNPLAMTITSSLADTRFNHLVDLVTDGSYAYVITDAAKLVIVNITNPASMTIVSEYAIPTAVPPLTQISVYGNVAYVSANNGTLHSINVTNRAAPVALDSIADVDRQGLAKIGNILICNGSLELNAIDVTSPSSMFLVDTILSEPLLTGAWGAAADASYFYVSCYSASRLTILEWAWGLSTVSGTVIATIPAGVVQAVGDFQPNLASTSTDNVVTWNVPVPVLTTLTIVGSVQNVALNGAYSVKMHPTNPDYVVVASWSFGGICTVDISDPANPIVADSISHANLGSAIDVAVQGSYAYVACQSGTNRFSIVDISDPLNLSLVSSITHANLTFCNGVAIQGDYAYATGNPGGLNSARLNIIDVTNRASPSIVSSLSGTASDLADIVFGVFIDGEYAYVASQTPSTGRVVVVNVSNPLAPAVVDAIASSGSLDTPYRFTRYDNTRLLVGTMDKLTMLNVADPNNISILSSYDTNDLSPEVCVWNGYPVVILHSFDRVIGLSVSGDTFSMVPGAIVTDSTLLDGAWAICTDENTQYIYATSRFDDRLTVIEVS